MRVLVASIALGMPYRTKFRVFSWEACARVAGWSP